jgi:hypothetical protein
VLGPKEAEMRIIGCDFHTREQTVAMLDTETWEIVNATLKLTAYSALPEENLAEKFERYRKSGSGRAFAERHLLSPLPKTGYGEHDRDCIALWMAPF